MLDMSAFYLLLEAFDRVGRARFGPDWNGREVCSIPREGAQTVRNRRRAIVERQNELVQEEDRLRKESFDYDDAEAVQRRGQKFDDLYQERDMLNAELNRLPRVTESYLADLATFDRRRRVEEDLVGAFASGELRLIVSGSNIVDWNHASSQPGFVCSFALSMVIFSAKTASHGRRGPAMVGRTEFDLWLRHKVLPYGNGEGLSPEERCELWLRKLVEGQKEKKRDLYQADAQAAFPGLSERAFKSLWRAIVPPEWSKSGPIKKR